MKLQKRFALSLAGLLLTAVTAWAGVTTDYNRNANFAQYKTYSWGKIQTANGLWDERVEDAVAAQLAAKGLTEVPSGERRGRRCAHDQQQLPGGQSGQEHSVARQERPENVRAVSTSAKEVIGDDL